MANRRWVQLVEFAVIVMFVVVTLLLLPVRVLTEPAGLDVANKTIRDSAVLPVRLWCWGWLIVFARPGWIAGVRMFWTLGCLTCLLHITVAFHLGHGWSHEAAWEHTRQVGGYGDGVYVNYLFALVWLADVSWAWASPGSYLTRPRWLHWTIHSFLAFVVFNAAVVFGSWKMRGDFVVSFLTPVLGVALVLWYLWRSTGVKRIPANPELSETPDIDHK